MKNILLFFSCLILFLLLSCAFTNQTFTYDPDKAGATLVEVVNVIQTLPTLEESVCDKIFIENNQLWLTTYDWWLDESSIIKFDLNPLSMISEHCFSFNSIIQDALPKGYFLYDLTYYNSYYYATIVGHRSSVDKSYILKSSDLSNDMHIFYQDNSTDSENITEIGYSASQDILWMAYYGHTSLKKISLDETDDLFSLTDWITLIDTDVSYQAIDNTNDQFWISHWYRATNNYYYGELINVNINNPTVILDSINLNYLGSKNYLLFIDLVFDGTYIYGLSQNYNDFYLVKIKPL